MTARIATYNEVDPAVTLHKAQLAVNVRDHGAVGDGVVDDTEAIQDAIDYILGAADPALNSRVPTAALYFPAGTYMISDTLLFRSVLGLHMFGAGTFATNIQVMNGADLDTAIDLDGICASRFENFRLTGTGTAQVDKGIHLRWSTDAARSTTGNTFRDIFVGNLKYRIGFAIEQDDGGRQGDECLYDNVRVAGAWTPGEVNWYQYGFRFGDATFGNVLNQECLKCNVSSNAIGVAWAGVSGSWTGGGCQDNEVDFHAQPNTALHISNVRCEDSKRLLTSTGYADYSRAIVLDNIEYYGNNLHADGFFIDHRHGGVLSLRDVSIPAGGFADPKIQIGALGTGGILIIDGVICQTHPDSFVTDVSGLVAIDWRAYQRVDSATGLSLGTWIWGEHGGDVASAATITVPPLAGVVNVTGTTNITSVTARPAGYRVTLTFAGVLTFTDGSNLKLNGNFVTSADDTITLVSDGTNWLETSRSAN